MLKTRVVTAIIAGLIVLCGILWGPMPWRILVWIGTLIGTWEYAQLIGIPRFYPVLIWAWLVVSVVIAWFPNHWSLIVPLLVGGSMLWPVLTRNRISTSKASTLGMGTLYLGYGGASLAAIRAIPHGVVWVFFLLISVWMTDTVAFFAGKRIGGPKLWPSISPAKTVSGAVAGVIGASVGSLIWGLLMIRTFDPVVYAVAGALISVAGQLGDLVESAYKRAAEVKDSGNLLPGHGGILDRVDSLFLAAPVAYFLIVYGSSTWFR